MKIVYVSDTIYPYHKGGKEKRLYEISTRLAKLGHEVHIYTMHWWDAPEKSHMEDGVQLHAISKLYDVYREDRRSIVSAVLFGLACLRLFRVKFDVLDVDHMPFFPIFSAWIVCTLRRKRFFGTWHEALRTKDWVRYMGKLGYIAAAIERVSIHLPYAVNAASLHTKKLISSELHRSKRVAIVSSGIDMQQIAKLELPAIRCDVLYTGRLVKDKNIDKLVHAFHIVSKELPSARCVIIGKGTEKGRIKSLINELGLQKHINLLDPLARAEEVYAYMRVSKVFCLPSIREGFGIVALESLGCGTPVVTTDCPANAAKDLIEHDVNGSVVPLEPAALAKAIIGWITKPKPDNIRQNVQQYDWDSLARQQAEAYS